METLHYIIVILSVIGGGFIYHQKLREQLITQRIDMMDTFNREHATNCLEGLKEINRKLDDLREQISHHDIEYTTVRNDVDNIKVKVDRLEAWFGKVIESK